MIKFFHRLLNPHCSECREDNICESCQTLRTQLELVNHDRKQLLSLIERLSNPKVEYREPGPPSDIKPVQKTANVPWRIQKGLLEAEDRKEAQLRREKAKEFSKKLSKEEVEELEKKVGIK